MAKALYICYFGVDEPLVQTQVIPYLREIIKGGTAVSLLTFEPAEKVSGARGVHLRDELAREAIEWHWLRYHKKPSVPATIYDLLNGLRFAVKLARREKIDVFHARGHIPAPIGALAKSICGGKLLFDVRGFMPEEYTDAGIWDERGYVYKSVKAVEKWLMKKSDGFVVLTEAARRILFPESGSAGSDKFGRPIEVIPCCVDVKRFEIAKTSREEIRRSLNAADRRIIVYVGSVGGWYLTEEMLSFFEEARRGDSKNFALILTQRNPDAIAARLKGRGLSEGDFYVASVAPADVPKYLAAADIAISFIRACFSKKSSSPTKIAEYLLAGLPIICNRGVGDIDAIVEGEQVGAIVSDFSGRAYLDALARVEELLTKPEMRENCIATARKHFDLESVGGERYRRIYSRLLNDDYDGPS